MTVQALGTTVDASSDWKKRQASQRYKIGTPLKPSLNPPKLYPWFPSFPRLHGFARREAAAAARSAFKV